MLTATVIVFVILIFPIYVNENILVSPNDKKGYFNINLFGFINVLGGYAEIVEEGLVFHVSNVKAHILPLKRLFFIKDNVKPLRDYHLKKCKIMIEKSQSDPIEILPYCFTLLTVNNILNDVIKVTKPYLDYDSVICLREGENYLNVYIKLSVVYNTLIFLFNLIKKMVGRSFYAKRKSK